ncbi:MAG: hypothetical protein R2827_10130 [Bdellovibrionales bacterium]
MVEPLRLLFKDEVRALGETLGVPSPLLWRHPFPPGLAIRIMGEITREDIRILQDADYIFRDELVCEDLYNDIGKLSAVLYLFDGRSSRRRADLFEDLALRAVTSRDGMMAAADWLGFFLSRASA